MKRDRWIINDPVNGRFEGIIAAVGTCGDAKMPHIHGMDKFKGEIYHSSDLTGKQAKGKTMIVIGGGASAVEALEFAAHEDAPRPTSFPVQTNGSSHEIPLLMFSFPSMFSAARLSCLGFRKCCCANSFIETLRILLPRTLAVHRNANGKFGCYGQDSIWPSRMVARRYQRL